MRNLDAAIKADFIRHANDDEADKDVQGRPQKTSVWTTLTRGRSRSNADGYKHTQGSSSPSKRSRSRGRAENVASDGSSPTKRARSTSRPRSLFSLKNLSSSSLHKTGLDGSTESKETPSSPRMADAVDPLRRPVDFINYLREAKNPQNVEVGKLHKLRLLLRNESVSWVDTFILKDGMKEMLDLLDRVREMTWR